MKSKIPDPEFLTVPSAAKICGVSRNTVYLWVRNGKLKAYQTPGKTNQIRPTDLVEFMENSGMFVPPALISLAQKDEKRQQFSPADETDESVSFAVLAVDDDPQLRRVIVRCLSKEEKVYEAETGFEALHILTMAKAIKVVLLDLRMPGQHGLNTLNEIKKIRPDVAIIVITGFVEDIPSELLTNGTIAGILGKPFTAPEIRAAVNSAKKQVPGLK